MGERNESSDYWTIDESRSKVNEAMGRIKLVCENHEFTTNQHKLNNENETRERVSGIEMVEGILTMQTNTLQALLELFRMNENKMNDIA